MNPLRLWRRFLALPNDSRGKTLGIALLVALVSAGAVTIAAVTLRPIHEENVDRQRQERLASILAAVPDLARIVGEAGVDALEMRLVDLDTGTFVSGDVPANFDARSFAADPTRSVALPAEADIAGIRRRAKEAAVYLLSRDDRLALLVLPIYGSGYQSTIAAYLALEPDLATVAALSIYEQAETPGLGARIEETAWQALWPGTPIVGETGAIRIAVVRGDATGPYEIDGITGATRTSSAVSNMVRFWLGEWGYGPFLANLRETLAVPQPAGPAVAAAEPAASPPAAPMVEGPLTPAVLFLADRHATLGLTCTSCHTAGAPPPGTTIAGATATSICLGCHGTYADVAGRTAALFPNPHASHLGELTCSSCHRAHQTPVDYCSQCHSFGFRVP